MPSITPQDPGFIETASEVITTEVIVAASPEEVWAVLTDNERWPEWFPAAKACRTTSEQSGGVGSTRWIHFDLFKVDERFVAWEPPRVWAFTITKLNRPGVVSVVERATLEPLGDARTRLTYVVAADVAAYMRPLVPLLRWRLGSLFRKGLAGIDGQVAKLRGEARMTS